MEIVLCVTGSVAAIETVKLVRELKRQGVTVKSFMSDGACQILHPYALEFATGQEVVTQLTGKIQHVKYAKTDLVLVAPATANVISKFTHKIADNPINTLLITAFGYKTPIIFVPSMHSSMYRAIAENIQKLKDQGIIFVDPKNEENKAKFPPIQDIILSVLRETSGKELKGKKVLISAGATFEKIDPVRGITNRSSGKMGLELAKEAFIRGAEVTMVCGKMEVTPSPLFKIINIESADEMRQEIEKQVLNQDIFISAAAVSDFIPKIPKKSKISSSEEITLKLEKAPKIIGGVKKINPEVFLVGFKAEYGLSRDELIKVASKRAEEFDIDLMVANDVAIEDSGFGSNKNQVILIDDEIIDIPLSPKGKIAAHIIDRIVHKI